MALITLTPEQIFNVRDVAYKKAMECELGKMKNRYNVPVATTSYDSALTGGYGEQALAVYLGVEWGFKPYDITANDVAGYEVRSTYHAKGRLLTHNEDKNGLYILAIIDRDTYTVNLAGWSNLKRCNTPGRWATDLPAPCYAMPQADLWPMEMLPATALYASAINN
jgi:hypothetical protein